MAKKKKEKKDEYVDDGRTIVDMNVEGLPWYDGTDPRKRNEDKKDPDKPTKRELIRMIFGMYKAMLPFLLITIGCFLLVAGLLYVALKFA